MFFFGTVLSDSNKRLMYDVGVYDSDDDENVSHLFHTIHELGPSFSFTCLLLFLCYVLFLHFMGREEKQP